MPASWYCFWTIRNNFIVVLVLSLADCSLLVTPWSEQQISDETEKKLRNDVLSVSFYVLWLFWKKKINNCPNNSGDWVRQKVLNQVMRYHRRERINFDLTNVRLPKNSHKYTSISNTFWFVGKVNSMCVIFSKEHKLCQPFRCDVILIYHLRLMWIIEDFKSS